MHPASTHLPVLTWVPKIHPVRIVVEFGCGYFSTPTFLNKDVYPLLQKLISLESNPDYATLIKKQAGDDKRLEMTIASEEDFLTSPLAPADLILVDGYSANMREKTAAFCANLAPVVILHDAENYMGAVRYFKFSNIYKGLVPWTALLSNSIDVSSWRIEA